MYSRLNMKTFFIYKNFGKQEIYFLFFDQNFPITVQTGSVSPNTIFIVKCLDYINLSLLMKVYLNFPPKFKSLGKAVLSVISQPNTAISFYFYNGNHLDQISI